MIRRVETEPLAYESERLQFRLESVVLLLVLVHPRVRRACDSLHDIRVWLLLYESLERAVHPAMNRLRVAFGRYWQSVSV